ncbi:MAG: HTH-type transcriptional regulator Hpr [Candidatus Heimdallarchaeota archaeon LC_2]|nr:MAG: HTH-type transcriptional regulator Hpr [Candidatus Heimdallarchaeota archaeon LC_2]
MTSKWHNMIIRSMSFYIYKQINYLDMQEFDITSTLSFMIAQVSKNHKSVTNSLLQTIGLFAGQEMVLTRLAKKPNIVLNELAGFLKTKPPTVTKVTKGLQDQGFLIMTKDEKDKRVTRVNLSRKGENLQEEIARIWGIIEKETFKSFSIEERVIFKRLMQQIIENLESINFDLLV